MQRKKLSIAIVLIAVFGLTACSTASKIRGALSDSSNLDYQNNQAIKQLEVPPDLTTPEFDKSFELPTGVISAVSLKNGGSGIIEGSGSEVSTTSNQGNGSGVSTTSNVGAVRTGDLSSIRAINGRTVLQVNDTYPRSVVLTEIMLVKMGFKVLNKSVGGDEITALYNGKDIATFDSEDDLGFFSKFKNLVTFGSERRKLNSTQALLNGKKYQITIVNEKGSPIVRFARTDGREIADAAHAKIITLLNTTFNS